MVDLQIRIRMMSRTRTKQHIMIRFLQRPSLLVLLVLHISMTVVWDNNHTLLQQTPTTTTSSSSSMVMAQATGFCHRPPIKPPTSTSSSSSSSSLYDYNTNQNQNDIFVIAHRGASYHIPIEHSLPSYRLALELSTHYIELDLAISSDGVVFPMHSFDLAVTTNILSSPLLLQNNTAATATTTTATTSNRQPWFSPVANRSAYWTFNFTFAELQTLTLQRDVVITSTNINNINNNNNNDRTDLYNHLFTIPSLNDVIHLLVDWNINMIPTLHSNRTGTIIDNNNNNSDDEASSSQNGPSIPPQIPNSYYDPYKAGLYIELKNTHWMMIETGYDMVQLLFQHITDNLLGDTGNTNDSSSSSSQPQQYSWKELLHCYERIRFDEYIIPPLIIQSFNHSDLLAFHNLWHTYSVPNFADPSTTTNQLSTIAPEPSYIVLVDYPYCYDDTFWYMISNDIYRSFINGIGCHKNCLLPYIPTTSGTTTTNNMNTSSSTSSEQQQQELMEEQHEHIEAMIQRITELQLVMHVWTERPEISYLTTTSTSSTTTTTSMHVFRTVMDEIYYLKCNVSHVHGIFTESVDMTIRALQIPCPVRTTSTTGSVDTPSKQQQSNTNDICSSTTGIQSTLVVSIVMSFLFGILVSFVMMTNRRVGRRYIQWFTQQRSTITATTTNSYQHATSVAPTNDDDDDDDYNYNDNGRRNGFKENENDRTNTTTRNGIELSSVT